MLPVEPAWVGYSERDRCRPVSVGKKPSVPRIRRSPAGRAVIDSRTIAKPARALGVSAMTLDTAMLMPRRPFPWRELVLRSWFVARVSIAPTLMLSIPFTVLSVFTFNILLVEFGAADFSGTGAALGAVTQIGPLVTVLVVAGAAATAMCADLGAPNDPRGTRRNAGNGFESGAFASGSARIGGHRRCPVSVRHRHNRRAHRRVCVLGLHPTRQSGKFVASLTLLTGLPEVVISFVKAGLFGLAAGLIACYKGISVGGGPAGVGNAVNETGGHSPSWRCSSLT